MSADISIRAGPAILQQEAGPHVLCYKSPNVNFDDRKDFSPCPQNGHPSLGG